MKESVSYFLLIIFALIVSTSASSHAEEYKEKDTKKVEILPCLSISDATARKLCNRERDLRIARRAIDILTIGPGGSTHGGASDCAATAEADCNGVLEDVDTLNYEGGICSWTCKAFETP